MKKNIIKIVLLLILFVTNQSFGQVTIWSEDFQANTTGIDSYTGTNGSWVLTSTGTNGSDAGRWRANDTESGNTPGTTGSAGGGDNSMFMGTADLYYGLGLTGASFLAAGTAETNKRIESPIIDCSAHTTITIEFDYIESRAGDPLYDPGEDATLWYFDGATWAQIDPIALTPNTFNPQGTWTHFTAFALPASADNNANVKIGFQWTCDTDANGIDPSFAVDDIIVKGIAATGGATITAAITTTSNTTTICEGTSLTFTDASTASGTTINSWSWTFDGQAPASVMQNPPAVTFNTAGSFDIILTAGDGTITDNITQTIIVNAAANSGTNNTANFCSNASPADPALDLNTLLGGGQDVGGIWTETSTTMSGAFTAATGVFDGNGLTIGNIYTFDYTVTGTSPCVDATSTITVTITDCSAGSVTADFNTTASTVCVGSQLTFTDASTASGTTINNWAWTFDGGAPIIGQGPQSYTFNTVGAIDVVLGVSDGTLTDSYTQTITVVAAPNSGADNTGNLCINGSTPTLDLSTLLSGADAGGTWTETTATPSGQLVGSIVTGTGLTVGNIYTFEYTVTGTSPCPDMISTFTITTIDCATGTPPTASFTPSQTTICQNDCITFTETSTPNDITTWSWDFDGGATNVNTQDPGSVCFNTAGTFDVTLTVTNPTGTNTSTITTITVNALPTVTIASTPSTTVCTGDQVTLTASGATSYLWDNGVNNGTAFTPSAGATTYTVTGTTNGCSNTASTTITVADCTPMIAGFSFTDNICLGSCISFTDTTTGAPVSWSWDFGTSATPINSNEQNPSAVCFNTVGVFNIQLTVTDAQGNSNSTTSSITVFDLPTITAFHDTLIDLGGEVELNSITPNFGDILWTPSTYYIDCDTCAITYAQPQLTQDYFVTITDPNGCKAQDTVKVIVNFIEGIGVPQAFSPNADGNNDQLVVKGYGISNMEFRVFNRYGQLIFSTTDQTHGWDGSFNGKQENPGVFVWTLQYTLLNGQQGFQKGNTTLIK